LVAVADAFLVGRSVAAARFARTDGLPGIFAGLLCGRLIFCCLMV
jgi:hypothetical protein